ncbi:2881_t:CDS:1, partial [Funneliformis caledonium]
KADILLKQINISTQPIIESHSLTYHTSRLFDLNKLNEEKKEIVDYKNDLYDKSDKSENSQNIQSISNYLNDFLILNE